MPMMVAPTPKAISTMLAAIPPYSRSFFMVSSVRPVCCRDPSHLAGAGRPSGDLTAPVAGSPQGDWGKPAMPRNHARATMTAMKILVTAASRHDATDEIATAIAEALTRRGHEAEACSIDAASPEGYDAVVLGSAVYIGRWLKPARQ